MAKYQQYDEYKDSEVGLLGRIPLGWKVLRYKNILKIMQGMAFKSSEYVDSSSVVNIRMGNIKKGGHIDLKHNTKYLPEKYKDIYSEYRLYEGDAIIAMTDMSPSLDFLAVPAILEGLDVNTVYLLNQRVGKLILDKEFDIRFIRYWLLSDELRRQLKAKGLGTVQANMSNDDLYGAYFLCPSLNERVKIVNFLDHETAQIDTLINKQQTLIQLLKEKRQAVISHAVTKGLNPDAPMKDSGVEFLSEVPEHWKVAKLKFYTNQIVDGAHFTPTYTNEGVPFLRVTDIHNDSINMDAIKYIPRHEHEALIKRCNPQKGDLLLSKNGTIGIPKVIDWEWEFSIFVSLCLIKFKESLTSQYAEYFFKSHEIKEQISGLVKQSTVINLHLDKIQNFWFSIPPINEQYEIVGVLNKKIDMFDSLVGKAEQAIQLMQERRTALISAAVTGKIDVRGWRASE